MTEAVPLAVQTDAGQAVASERQADRLQVVCFAAVAMVVTGYRMVVLLRHGAPPTIDAGDWLAYGHSLLGEHIRSPSLAYPPVVPLFVSGATSLLGVRLGVSSVAAMSGLGPGIVVFGVLRRCSVGWPSVVLAGLLLASASIGEAVAWGGFPQLLGIAVMLAFLWYLDRYATRQTRPNAIACGLAFAGCLATSDYAASIAVVAGAILVVLRLTDGTLRHRPRFSHVTLMILPALALAPMYIHLVGAVRATAASRPQGAQFPLSDLLSHLEFIYRDFRLFWRLALALALFMPIALLSRRREPLWALPTSLALATVSLALGLREDRYLYLAPLFCVMLLGLWMKELGRTSWRRSQHSIVTILTVAMLVQTYRGSRLFETQREYYGIVTRDMVNAMDWVRAATPSNAVIGVPSFRNAPLGWWIEGYAHRSTLLGSPLRWLNYADEQHRALAANQIFTAYFPSVGQLELAAADGATYLFVPIGADNIRKANIVQFQDSNPQLVAYSNNTVIVFKVAPIAPAH